MRKLKLQELGRVSLDEFKSQAKTSIVIVLDNIRSGLNVGSAFRTSDAFALEKIVLCGITAQPPHREITKTAIGATSSVDWEYEKDILTCVKNLQAEGYTVLAIEQVDESIFLQDYEIDKNQKYALVFGNEVKGVSDEIINEVDACIEIPQFGTKHSLNISVSLGITIWEFAKVMKLKY